MKKKSTKLTHVDAKGRAHMVDVSDKDITRRTARARAVLRMKKETRALIFDGNVKKGDAVAIAKIAGILAAKRVPDLIPLCHTIALSKVSIEIEKGKKPGEVVIVAVAEALDRTGVEMESLTAASVAALTIYDMVKSVDRGVSFEVSLEEKRGGKSGDVESAMTTRLLAIRDVRIDPSEVALAVSHPGAGGIATFSGVVRNTNEGRPVLRLEYEAYASMAEKELVRIASEIELEFSAVRAAAVHRVGMLEIGDVAVVCAASAPHREEAFHACRLLIDRIKERLPIWKREHYAEGDTKWVACAHPHESRMA